MNPLILLGIVSITVTQPPPQIVEQQAEYVPAPPPISLGEPRVVVEVERIPTSLKPIWERIPGPMPTVYRAEVIEASDVYLTIEPHRCLGIIGNGEVVDVEVPETGDGYVVARFREWRFFIKKDRLEPVK